MASIKDVAKSANVSIGTVSKYLNGVHILPSNSQRIEQAIRSLNYHVNIPARALKTNRSSTIAVMLPDIAGSYYPRIVKEMEYELYKLGYTVLIVDSHDHDVEQKKIRIMMERMVDGFIVFPLEHSADNYQTILDAGIPLCIVDQFLPALACPQVVSDNVMAGYRAASVLLNRGNRRVAVITGEPENTTAAERLNGYRAALTNFGIPENPDYIITRGFEESDGYEGAKELFSLPAPPTALIACNHHTTLGAVMFALDSGISIPGVLDLIGFDYEQLPRLTRMHFGIVTQSIRDIAKTAVEQLIRQISSGPAGELLLQRIPTIYTE